MRFRKIKQTKEGKIHIEYEVKNQKGGMDEFSFTCSDEPKPEFKAALQDLGQDVIEMCELPEEYITRVIVTGVSFSYGSDAEIMGATLIAQMKLKKSNVNLNLNTPHKIEEFYSETGGDQVQLLGEECVSRLKELIDQTGDYVKGVRAQGQLFGEKEGLEKIVKEFHDNMQKGLGPGESVTISSGGKSTTIEGGCPF